MIDGRIDYSVFTDAELQEARASINGDAYPVNLANLNDELARRATQGSRTELAAPRGQLFDDGNIDFTTYSDDELEQAASTIDGLDYPKNFEALKAERARRRRRDRAENGNPAESEAAAVDVEPERDGWLTYMSLRYTGSAIGLIIMGFLLMADGEVTLGGESDRVVGKLINFMVGGERSFQGVSLVFLSLSVVIFGIVALASAIGSFRQNDDPPLLGRFRLPLLIGCVACFVLARVFS